eukprot:3246308-Alexandrium_andersonii.AAC.1
MSVLFSLTFLIFLACWGKNRSAITSLSCPACWRPRRSASHPGIHASRTLRKFVISTRSSFGRA